MPHGRPAASGRVPCLPPVPPPSHGSGPSLPNEPRCKQVGRKFTEAVRQAPVTRRAAGVGPPPSRVRVRPRVRGGAWRTRLSRGGATRGLGTLTGSSAMFRLPGRGPLADEADFTFCPTSDTSSSVSSPGSARPCVWAWARAAAKGNATSGSPRVVGTEEAGTPPSKTVFLLACPVVPNRPWLGVSDAKAPSWLHNITWP